MTFAAGHRLFNPTFTDEQNREVFGDCSNPNGHGHNYTLFVTVSGPLDESTGMIINLKEMKMIIQERIIDKVDHKNLNVDVDFMTDVIPTTENFAQKIWIELHNSFSQITLEKITLWESENNKVEVTR